MKRKFLDFSTIIEQTYNYINLTDQSICPHITFQVTENCNLCCSYCYQINKTENIMSLDTAKKFIDLLIKNDENTKQYLDTQKCKGVVLDFIGGEPFLQIKLIDQIIEYFRIQTILHNHPWQNNWKISMSSNGTLYFNPEVQEFIKKYNNFLSLGITIDGNKELHDSCRKFPDGSGSYDLAIAASRHYRKNFNKNLSTKMTLSPQNIQYTFNALVNFINEGFQEINLNCVFEKGWENKHATILYYELKKVADYILENNLMESEEDGIYIAMFEENFFKPKDLNDTSNWCGGNGRMIAVNHTGNIYPCIRYMESSLGPDIKPIIIGNVDTGIMTDANCRTCINKLKAVNRINQSTEECLNCPIAEGCAWCQAYNYQDSGDFEHRATYICCTCRLFSKNKIDILI